MNKPQILFYLNRTLRSIESETELDHQDLARQGVSYAERGARAERAKQKVEEAAALRKAIEHVNETMQETTASTVTP